MNPSLVLKAAELISLNFSSDQSHHILQQLNGTYRKTFGKLTPQLIADSIHQSKSIGSYQKRLSGKVNWLCFDFDIKSAIEESKRQLAISTLITCVNDFCNLLKTLNIPFSREHSGNRGQHIWIFFEEEIGYSQAYEIASSICTRAALNFDSTIIALDRFPPTRMPSEGPGLGVKLPLSKHKKSNRYSMLMEKFEENSNKSPPETLFDCDLEKQIQLLEEIKKISKYQISDILGVPIWDEFNEIESPYRVRNICLTNQRFSINELVAHWQKTKALKPLAEAIQNSTQLNNNQRKLIVGILININSSKNFSSEILHEIFSKFPNYNQEKTEAAIQSLSGFHFPSQEQIETIVGIQFKGQKKLTLTDLLKSCIPYYSSHEDATFDISGTDCHVTKLAELNYTFENDEAIAYSIVNKLLLKEGPQFSSEIQRKYIPQPDNIYEHFRQESLQKERRLVSLGANERVITSAIIKQIDNFLDFRPSINSFGYQIQKNFKGGRIFQPWLVRWSNFISDIDNIIEDESKLDYFVVKTDISSFYDKIPHEYIRRMMLGGGGNHCINIKYANLNDQLRTQYHSLVDKLFEINSSTVTGLYGLPQGPAYARYLAELYLDELDRMIDDSITNGEVAFYHRYVDDIFILCRDANAADEAIENIRSKLSALGLTLNESKTVKAKVESFYVNFDKYKKQAKYVADRASRDIEDAGPKQRSEAINAFMQVLKSDSASEDLTFIFSHFRNIQEIDDEKLKLIRPILQNRLGRGRMMKHLFQFGIEDESRWEHLTNNGDFSELQAEVLSGVLLDFALSRVYSNNFLEFIETLTKAMPSTRLVKENLCFLHLVTGANINCHFDSKIAIRCAVLMPRAVNCPLPPSSVTQLISTLDAERSLPIFCHALYLLCFGEGLEGEKLNQLAQVFFAKIGRDEVEKILNHSGNSGMYSVGVAKKFYELLCLFSMSTHGSIELVKACWRFCSDIFDKTSLIRQDTVPSAWYTKLSFIELDRKKINLVLTSILEGNINPGSRDTRKAFDRFHNTVIYHVASSNATDLDQDTATIMEQLRKKALFYDWLIERAGVSPFPTRSFFERNSFDNDCIMLRKGSQVLIRRPVEELINQVSQGHHAGYAEILVPYDSKSVVNLEEALNDLNFLEKLSYLEKFIESANKIYPNVFPRERVIDKESLSPFTEQLTTLSNILYEDTNDFVSVLPNNINNFVNCFFRSRDGSTQPGTFYELGEKYVKKLKDLDITKFLKNLIISSSPFSLEQDRELLDRCVASALWNCLESSSNTRRVSKFLDYYNAFTRSLDELHIFCIDESLKLENSNPKKLCESVISSIELNWTRAAPGLPSFMTSDIDDYVRSIESILDKDEALEGLDLEKFKRTRVQIMSSEKKIYIGDGEYNFEQVYLVNAVDRAIQSMSVVNSFFIQVCQHVFVYTDVNERIFILGLDRSIGAAYDSITRRHENIEKSKLPRSYQPITNQTLDFTIYENFSRAIDVVAEHRDILKPEAFSITTKWLSNLPKKYHRVFINLLAGHEVMRKGELDEFSRIIGNLLQANEPMFFLKDVVDHNGTHRIIYRNPELGRIIANRGPESIPFGANTVTLVVDNVLTGSQIINTLKFYFTGQGSVDSGYFPIKDQDNLRIKLSNIKTLKIRQVLHTSEAIERIQSECRSFMSNDIEVIAIGGRDIGGNAFFAKSKLISSTQKQEVLDIFSQESEISEMRSYLDVPSSFSKLKNLNELDLVARFQSLPKKCFSVLHSPLRNGQEAPLMKIREAYEQI